MTPLDILRQYWGYTQFRPLQEDIIRAVSGGSDTLALLPTGGGKSICFQVPALLRDGLCIVVTPLIALMKDQVEQLERRHIPAKALYAGLPFAEMDMILESCAQGKTKFLYLSPERLMTDLLVQRVRRMQVGLLVVDEAHCISQWGYDFRPPYLQIARFRALIPGVPCIAVTASATPTVKADIQEKLAFRQPAALFQGSFARPNLAYAVRWSEQKEEKLLQMLRQVPGTAVVYVRNRKRTQVVAEMLASQGISATWYHAGLDAALRTRRQDDWIAGRVRVMVSTNAFGMGIDKPDVRLVVHIDLPDTLEAYYQEAGRAGRDGQKAYAAILYDHEDIAQLRKRIAEAYPPVEILRRTYQALANHFKLAVGSQVNEALPFDLLTFCQTYQLHPAQTHHALRLLQEQGFLEVLDDFATTSKVHIHIPNGQLYKFQVDNKRFEPLIRALLSQYGGALFTDYVRIDEQVLAKISARSREEVVRELLLLANRDVLHYQARTEQPRILFTRPRYHAPELPLDQQGMTARRRRDEEKAEAVVRYTTQTQVCRTLLVLEYFGEFGEEACGICDVCRRQAAPRAATPQDFHSRLMAAVAEGPQHPGDLAERMGILAETLAEHLQPYIASGELIFDAGLLRRP